MKFFLACSVIIFANVLVQIKGNCDKEGILIYEDLACTPRSCSTNDACPKSYDCSHIKPLTNECRANGKIYQPDTPVDRVLQGRSCNAGCICVNRGQEKASFICAVLDCAEWLGAPTTPGCERKYNVDGCCSSGEICPPFENLATCEYDGTTYKEGQKFFPNSTCDVCVCQKGFTGKVEAPFCRRIACAVELKNSDKVENNCAPVYSPTETGKLCCPRMWICANDDDVINPPATPVTSDEKCKFGTKDVQLGETLERSTTQYGSPINIRCECKIPPLLTCVTK